MSSRKLFTTAVLVAGLAAIVVPLTTAEETKITPANPPMQLPPGWSQADMDATIAAAMPGKMHEFLMKDAGTWKVKNVMWMAPDTPPISCDSINTFTPLMNGRFLKCETTGEMPGMGPFSGLGFYGFDNVSQKFVLAWIDSTGTGIINGTGELSPDSKTLTWTITANNPLTKKPMTIRQVDTYTSPNTKSIEMFGADLKSGKEFKMMAAELTRQ
ncbi:MAG: DUF1579 domain-containing protein [Phycisphaerae bacterium]